MRAPVTTLAAAAAALCLSASTAAATAPLPSSDRRSPIVRVVESASPAVVNISTEQRVDNPFHRSGLDGFFSKMLDPSAPDPAGPPGDEYVQNSLGSGVIIDPRGYILTNEHVLWRASRVHVVMSDRRKFDAEVVGVDPRSDLAVLRIDTGDRPLTAVRAGTSSDLMIGETVIAIGNPYGLSNTVTTGVVSALARSIKAGDRVYSDFIQTDASINPGNSGGPLLNVDGELIGINTAILDEGQRIGFAIPVDRARKVVDDLIRYGEIRVAWLGLDVRDLSDRDYANLVARDPAEDEPAAVSVPAPGAPIRRIYAGGPAEAAGLEVGDLVTALGDEMVSSRTDFETAASKLKPADKITVSYRRGTADRKTEMTAAGFPDSIAEEYLADQLGLEFGDIPAEWLRRYPGLPADGVVVIQVRNRSRGFFAGLERGDILRGIDDSRVARMADLSQAAARIVGRDAVLLKVVRGRFQYNVTVDLD